VSRRRGIAVTVVRNERYREGNGLSALAARDRVGYDPFAGACWRRHGGRVFSRPVRPAPTVATKVPPRAQTPGTSEGQRSAITDRRRVSWSAIEIAGGWAETSQRLSNEERDELVRLRKKARNRRTPLTKAEQAKYASLVVKAVGTERVRDWLDRQSSPASESPRAIREVNAAERLKTAADLRDAGVITEDDFQALKVRYLEEL
jgi:hypothetical protein